MEKISYLVFGGGGAAGYAFSGVISELAQQPHFSFSNIKGVAGTSVGAIAALVVALNYDPDIASQKLFDLDLKNFSDGGHFTSRFFRLCTKYGKFQGEALASFIHMIIRDKISDIDPSQVTFADLKARGFKDLLVVTTKLFLKDNIPTGKQKIFSFETTPSTPIAAAIRASTAAPTIFQRVRLKKVNKGEYIIHDTGDLYEDGGILDNFPIDIFDNLKYCKNPDKYVENHNEHTLGFALVNPPQIEKPVKTRISDAQPLVFAESLFNTLIHQVNNVKLEAYQNKDRIVFIDRKNVQIADFDLSHEKKLELVNSGINAVRAYFAGHSYIEPLSYVALGEYSNSPQIATLQLRR